MGDVEVEDFAPFGCGGGNGDFVGCRGRAGDDHGRNPSRLQLGVGRSGRQDVGPDVVAGPEGRGGGGRLGGGCQELTGLKLLKRLMRDRPRPLDVVGPAEEVGGIAGF
jgi:hypothetical protein